ncbi:hypothetical protein OCL06_15970 [Alteromonas sp. ASW11-19]|uniref:Uncharacterized protein n=1 Tax=Alteromonas salexigens TaxID=2982530 RepID=A0ABT2VSP7_9ALTE|nr:hypothetical protein [Alteromonas salexigens]MCU7556089.1 hypothetical protein [Alteromonas salexigens]
MFTKSATPTAAIAHNTREVFMANYYTDASFIVPLTPEQTEFALKVLQCATDDSIDFTKKHKTAAAKQYEPAVFRLAKKLAKAVMDESLEEVCLDFRCEQEPKGLWISHDETINTYHAATFTHLIMKHFDIDGYIDIQAAHTCNKRRLDAFGGHAAFITKKEVKWTSTHQWVYQQAKRSGLSPAA